MAYTPDRVWQWEDSGTGAFSGSNRPTAGAREERALPTGEHPLQLYSMATPNGVKVTVLLEELLACGHSGAEYDAFPIHIGAGDQFTSGFVAINPNSKIPALVDRSGAEPLYLFESGSILLHLAEKFGEFLPARSEPAARAEVLNWLFWQVGSGPYIGGGFGHFYHYAPEKIKYAIDRFTMEAKRQLDLLNQVLAQRPYIAGTSYSIADMAIWPWYGALVSGKLYESAEFIDAASYTHVLRWHGEIAARPAAQRGCIVNRFWGDEDGQLPERHSSADFVGKKLG